MAKIYGVELKAVKHFAGHGGICYQGNVYKDGKKVGFWTQDSWGGSDDYGFDTSVLEDVVEKMRTSPYYRKRFLEVESKRTKIPMENLYNFLDEDTLMLDTLMCDLISLREDESIYKKNAKNGYPITAILSDGYHIYTIAFVEKATEEYIAEEIEACKKEEIRRGTFFKDVYVETRVYRSLKDFVIVE